MPKASEVAAELRRVADAFDLHPDVEVKRPDLDFFYWSEKDDFLRTVSIFPKPLEKSYEDGTKTHFPSLTVTHTTDAIRLYATVQRSALCVIVEPARPAVYDCPPLLSEIEEASIGAQP